MFNSDLLSSLNIDKESCFNIQIGGLFLQALIQILFKISDPIHVVINTKENLIKTFHSNPTLIFKKYSKIGKWIRYKK